MNVEEATRLIGIALSTLPNVQQQMSDEQIDRAARAWSLILPDMSYQRAQAALMRVLRTHKFSTLPQPAELLQALTDWRGLAEPTALVAWGEVVQAFQRCYSQDEPAALATMSSRTAYVVKHMGWAELCMTDIAQTGVIRGQFCRLYEQSQERERDVAALPPGMRKDLAFPEPEERKQAGMTSREE